jgi:hypothetical protein
MTKQWRMGGLVMKKKIAEVGFASQKNFIGLYILKQDVMEIYKDQLKGRYKYR